MTWIDEAITTYVTFLKEHIKPSKSEAGWYTITTPFLNMYNDCIEIYCRNEDGKITLSDDGMTLRNLELCGINISRAKSRKQIFNQVLLNYGISLIENHELIVETNIKEFAQAKHNILCAIMEISDMYMLAKPTILSAFQEDVTTYLNEQNIIYTPGFIAKGSTGLEFNFAFQIAGKTTEILINTFNTINKNNLTSFLFDWNDIKEARQKVSKKDVSGLAIINDEKSIDQKYLDALTRKGTDFILYSKRNTPENVKKLKAA